jgi:polar amino acid transport system permease protein
MNLERVWTAANWERFMVGDLFNGGQLGGLALTLAIGLLAIPLATLIGSIFGVMRAANSRGLRTAALIYVNAFRNVPLLILVFWAYFLPPVLGFELSRFVSVLLAIVLFTGAYITEIVASGIRAVPETHVQAARALGLSSMQVQLWVVLPQAFYNMLPALTGRYVLAIKNTSLAFLIGLAELTEIGKQVNVQLMSAPVAVYFTILMIYFVVNRFVSSAFGLLEKRERFGKVFLRL